MEPIRETKRVKTDLQCSWGLTDACPRNGKITSLSQRGSFVKTTANVTDGQTIFVNCWLPQERRWVMLRGVVSYHIEKIGFGLNFTDLTAEQKETLSILIEHYRANPVK
jgi:hypothetical protein